jgi:two-component system, NtrC family, response regulator AtoC
MALPQPTQAQAAMPPQTPTANSPADLNLKIAINDVEKRCILTALDLTSGNRTEAAALLGLNRTTLVEKLRKFDL